MPVLTPITVIKRDATGVEVFRYSGVILRQEPERVVLEARFNRSDLTFTGTVLRHGDRFVETFYTDRWYNIFEIHDLQDDRIKGWYCNVGRPAVREADDRLSYVDLALDLWVAPDGSQTVLDEAEFIALQLDGETRRAAKAGLEELKKVFSADKRPGLG
jgi:predicted RNA-binding protein associated with RNAse of E/G family